MARRINSKDAEAIRQKLGQRVIVLVGLMGAGKSIPEIFADHGEDYFRDGERKVIARLLDGGACVLATGGGAYINDETRELIRKKGVSVWLKAELPLLMSRVSRRSNRPLLQSEDPQAVMRRLMEERYPIYSTADITVLSRDVAHSTIVNDVMKALAQWPGLERSANEQI